MHVCRKVHNAKIFQNSALFILMSKGQFVPMITMDSNGMEIVLVILGNLAYPLLPWLIKPSQKEGTV